MRETAAIFDMDVERDRKTCIALAVKEAGATREWAQWLLDHSYNKKTGSGYSNETVAGWVGRHQSYIALLRKWARRGFSGTPFDRDNKPDSRGASHSSTPRREPNLKSLDNSVPTEEEAEESYQETLFEQACLFLEEMTDETRQRLFAKLKGDYGYVS